MKGKFIPFVVGGVAGIVALLIFSKNGLDSKAVPAPELYSATNTQPEPPVRSPLSVVVEEPEEPEEPEEIVDLPPEITPEQLEVLLSRLQEAEERIDALELALDNNDGFAAEDPDVGLTESEPNLLESGFDPFTVDVIKNVRNELQLERLELQDRAAREGWINSDQYRQAMRDLHGNNRIRETLGDAGYDRLLLAEGRDNRIGIEDVMANSAAAGAGIQTGDTIYRYADERIFTYRDLRSATAAGTKGAQVAVQVVRDGALIDLVIPRGPLGVSITSFTDAENQ